VADVPVCTYLSGGIDSTVVCALMKQEGVPVKAFNVGFSGSVYDESERARRIAAHLGVEFESLRCPMETLAEHLPKTLFHTETVFFNPSALGKLMLSSEVRRQNFKVTITGEGADEVFAGYPYFKLEKLWRLSQGTPEEARRARALFAQFRKLEQRS